MYAMRGWRWVAVDAAVGAVDFYDFFHFHFQSRREKINNNF